MILKLAHLRSIAYYYIGDAISRLFDLPYMSWLYAPYIWCMFRSIEISDEYNLDVWEKDNTF